MCSSVAKGVIGGALPALPIVGKVQKKVDTTMRDILPEKTIAGKAVRVAQDSGPKLYN